MNEILEVRKAYMDMVRRHKEESLEMVRILSCSSLDDDEFLETFWEISDYNNTLYSKLEVAKSFMKD